jgi:5'-3' exonuclease
MCVLDLPQLGVVAVAKLVAPVRHTQIMRFIRALRSDPGYDPQTRHCVYGQVGEMHTLREGTYLLLAW